RRSSRLSEAGSRVGTRMAKGGSMNILETIVGARDGGAVEQLSAQFGLRPEQARSAVAALLPALATGLQRNMSSESALASLVGALSGGRHEAYLDDPSTLARPATTDDSNAILGHVLGNKDVSRQVAARAAERTGIETSTLKKMLPLVA